MRDDAHGEPGVMISPSEFRELLEPTAPESDEIIDRMLGDWTALAEVIISEYLDRRARETLRVLIPG